MKWLHRSLPLFALVWVACSASNTPVADSDPSLAPTISKFSPDTVWTLGTLTIHGSHFGYDAGMRVVIDTAQAQVTSADDTIMTVAVPETAQTGLIRVATINGSAISAKLVVVESNFHPHAINDSLPVGASFSIPGTGMNHYHGYLRLTDTGALFPINYPIDSVFSNRIVSHVVSNGLSGSMYLNDSDRFYNVGTLTITRPSSWNTLSAIWDHVTVTETHTRTGYVNGPAYPIDSTWNTTAAYVGQRDANVFGVPFVITAAGLPYAELQYTIAAPSLQIIWDTISQSANVSYGPYSYSETATHTIDTEWYSNGWNMTAKLPVANAIEFTLPNFSYQITEDSTDTQGLVNWRETTTATLNSGLFDLILKP